MNKIEENGDAVKPLAEAYPEKLDYKRRHTFRIWDTFEKRWDYISPLMDNMPSVYHDDSSLGIWTGFRCYSGERIFEGDMISINGLCHYVRLDGGAFMVKPVGSCEDTTYLLSCILKFEYESGRFPDIKIIGNSYEISKRPLKKRRAND